jgi:hypothetical protein
LKERYAWEKEGWKKSEVRVQVKQRKCPVQTLTKLTKSNYFAINRNKNTKKLLRE